MVAQTWIIAKWSEVAQKHSHSTLAYDVNPFTKTKAEISNLALDLITQIILENEPYGWSLNEKSDPSQHGESLNSTLANPGLLGGDQLMDGFELDTDLTSLQADVMALDAEIYALVQQHYG
ncbi:hypothetical protein Trco_006528 [Trichoderma cornu-damae]|uniref:Uncharacterized protein n=1 Tax=Trichoderma cornu-damae TaxID=654480 RepID=A0A9P8TRV8_9HYPO|nr:hypothetical protein Trco_006528 [Trichoderma cornu-damae]